jgi:hypothetical protein
MAITLKEPSSVGIEGREGGWLAVPSMPTFEGNVEYISTLALTQVSQDIHMANINDNGS